MIPDFYSFCGRVKFPDRAATIFLILHVVPAGFHYSFKQWSLCFFSLKLGCLWAALINSI